MTGALWSANIYQLELFDPKISFLFYDTLAENPTQP